MMRVTTLRLCAFALLTVAAVAGWNPAGLRAQSPVTAGQIYGAGESPNGQLQTWSGTTLVRRFVGPSATVLDDVVMVSAGGLHTLMVRADGSVWGQGLASSGQLGPTTGATNVPILIPGLPAMASVEAGSTFSLGIDQTGAVWAWGNNSRGQLGDGSLVSSPTPVPIMTLSNVVKLTAGSEFAVALDTDGAVWAWGNNGSGQVGQGAAVPTAVTTPLQVAFPGAAVITDIAAGPGGAVAISTTGNLYAWGFTAAASQSLSPVLIPTPGPVVSAALGGQHALLALADGTVWARGNNNSGQLGVSASFSNSFTQVPGIAGITKVAAGAVHSLALRDDGSSWGWGSNQQLQLGKTGVTTLASPTLIPGLPATVRDLDAFSTANASLWVTDPPVVDASVMAPPEATCTAPFTADVTLRGYNVVGVSPADIVLVLDESGSIAAADFEKLRQFASNFVNAQNFAGGAAIGLVTFTDTARVLQPLTTNKATLLNAIAGNSQAGGGTCIGCGLNAAVQQLGQLGRPGSDRLIVVVTDGINNQPAPATTAQAHLVSNVTAAHAASTVFAIGVGPSVDANQISFVASAVPNVKTAFLTPDFSSLSNIVSSLAIDIQPGVKNVSVTIDLGSAFAQAGAVTTAAGTVASNVGVITWTIPQLGRTPVTASIPLRGTGQGGLRPVFDALSFTSAVTGSHSIESPMVSVRGCAVSVSINPASASILTGQTFSALATVVDDFGQPVASVPVVLQATSGPNAGLSLSGTTGPAGTAAFSYSSATPGTDTLSIGATGVASPASAQVTWRRPNTAPVVTAGPPQAISLSGASTATIALAGSASDDGQLQPLNLEWTEGGVVVGTGSAVTLSRPAGAYTFTLTASDGELSSQASTIVTVADPTPPLVVPSIAGTVGANGWYTSDVVVSWAVTDVESILTSSTGCTVTTVAADGSTSVTCAATSAGGTTTRGATVTRDATAPELTVSPALSVAATSAAGATVSYAAPSAADLTSGVAAVSCAPVAGLFPIGQTLVTCTATDNAGNTRLGTFTVTVRDTTPPVVTSALVGTLGANGWYTSDVTLSWDVTDPDTGITSTTGCATTIIATDGVAITATCSATSAGGTTTQSVSFNRDASAATLSVPANLAVNADSWDGATVTYAPATAVDPVSGIRSVVCTPATGATLPIGITTVTCVATNNAGLTSTGAFTVTVTDRNEPGRMFGEGEAAGPNSHTMEFNFAVLETARGLEWGNVKINVKDTRRRRGGDERFDARTVDAVWFSDAPAYGPGNNPRTGSDTVTFRGTGRWDGRSGYAYVVTASDRGEPGRGRDTFVIEITAPNGTVVFTGGGTLSDGNIQSTRLRRPSSWWLGHRGNPWSGRGDGGQR